MAKDQPIIVKTGTPGLDDLMTCGGFRFQSSVLVSGEPGAGKSILALQFIYNGARLYGEGGVFVTSEQSAEKVRENAKSVGMDLEEWEKKGLIKIMKIPVTHGYEMAPDELIREVRKIEVKRVAIDSITPLEYLSEDIRGFRARILSFIETLTAHNVTLLVTAEKKKTDFDSIEFSPEDFLFDGLILMGRLRRAVSFERVISVVKMRGTKHSEEMHPVEISNSGLVVKNIQE
jgi:KaiC/GvpD/RAD55 family RecA-like ATPase